MEDIAGFCGQYLSKTCVNCLKCILYAIIRDRCLLMALYSTLLFFRYSACQNWNIRFKLSSNTSLGVHRTQRRTLWRAVGTTYLEDHLWIMTEVVLLSWSTGGPLGMWFLQHVKGTRLCSVDAQGRTQPEFEAWAWAESKRIKYFDLKNIRVLYSAISKRWSLIIIKNIYLRRFTHVLDEYDHRNQKIPPFSNLLTCTQAGAYTHTHTHTNTHTHARAHTHAHTRTSARTRTHTHMHTRTHACTRTCTHT